MPIRVCVINQLKGDASVRAGLALSPRLRMTEGIV